MNFNFSNIHTIFENENSALKSDNTLSANNESSVSSSNENIRVIPSSILESMRIAASDPKNLKITVEQCEESDDINMFIEAVELMTFCEANNCNPGYAADMIKEACCEELDLGEGSKVCVVFPTDSLNKDTLGSENCGYATKYDWARQLMNGCRRFGLEVCCSK